MGYLSTDAVEHHPLVDRDWDAASAAMAGISSQTTRSRDSGSGAGAGSGCGAGAAFAALASAATWLTAGLDRRGHMVRRNLARVDLLPHLPVKSRDTVHRRLTQLSAANLLRSGARNRVGASTHV
eukprot:TRINITY_DN12740_c0_g1_i2.p1 TRINITY_DN12740_c0_g1~~TRINITY_DN12740_c0_g1_i2.p1  ORF type:complete len:125 (-),score=10.71 TRINITY_DN12740_c0_g1_i2:11-385(-)